MYYNNNYYFYILCTVIVSNVIIVFVTTIYITLTTFIFLFEKKVLNFCVKLFFSYEILPGNLSQSVIFTNSLLYINF